MASSAKANLSLFIAGAYTSCRDKGRLCSTAIEPTPRHGRARRRMTRSSRRPPQNLTLPLEAPYWIVRERQQFLTRFRGFVTTARQAGGRMRHLGAAPGKRSRGREQSTNQTQRRRGVPDQMQIEAGRPEETKSRTINVGSDSAEKPSAPLQLHVCNFMD